MAYSSPSTKVTGDLVSAADWNQNTVNNVIALLPIGLEYFIQNGGTPIATGYAGHLQVPAKCDLSKVELLAYPSGSIQIDIWKCSYSDWDGGSTHPVNGDSICASAEPAITSSTKSTDSSLSGWTTAITAGDILWFNVDSAATVEYCLLSIWANRS